MPTNFHQPGLVDTVIAPYAVLSGGGCKVGTKFGVANNDALISTAVELTYVGIHTLAKDASTFSDGDTVYWDDTNKVVTSTSTGNMSIGAICLTNSDGTAAVGGLTGATSVRVRLHGVTGALGTNNLDGSTTSATATALLTAANIIAMNGAPVSVLAAPGVGKAIIVNNVLFEITTTSTQFTGGGVVTFNYTGGSVAVHAGSVPAATVTTTAGTSYTLLGPAVGANGTVVPSNTGISVTNASAAFAAGTGTAKVFIQYRIVNL